MLKKQKAKNIKIINTLFSFESINLYDYLKTKDGTPISEVYDKPSNLVTLIVSNLFIVAGLLFLLYVLAGGFNLITAGSGDKKAEATKQITTALAGFGIMFAAYWIVQIIKAIVGM